MNTQQNNSKLTQLPVVMFLAGICCFLWGSATPAIKTGYQLFQIQSSDAMSIILFAGMRFRTGRLSGNTVPQYPGTSLDYAGTRFRKSYCIPLFKPDSSSVLFLLYMDLGSCKWSTTVPLSQEEMFFISILVASLIFRYEKTDSQKNDRLCLWICRYCYYEPVRSERKHV